jgi:hypothetical protein
MLKRQRDSSSVSGLRVTGRPFVASDALLQKYLSNSLSNPEILPLKWWAQCHLFDLTGRSFTLAAFFRCTFQSFPAFIAAVVRGLAAAYVKDLNVFFTSLFNVLPTLVLLLGGATARFTAVSVNCF